MDSKVIVRTFEPNDANFITSTFLRGVYYGNSFYKKIDQDTFFVRYKAVLATLLSKSTLSLRVACLADDTDIILGWAMWDGPVLHYIYVKDAFRRQGIAKLLTAGAKLDTVTHITTVGDELRQRYGWKFNPFLV